MHSNSCPSVESVDSRTTLTIVREILSWSDAQWKKYETNLNPEMAQELRQELNDLGELFGKMKGLDYNWRKAVLVCLPTNFVGLPQQHFLAVGCRSLVPDDSLKPFAQYCSHKNLLEHFYVDDGEQAPVYESHDLTNKHAELRELFVADLYKGWAKVLDKRGDSARELLKSLFWQRDNGEISQEKSYKSQMWEEVLQKIGPYAYLLRDPESVLARDPVSTRVTTFIRQISDENNLSNCPTEQVCRRLLDEIPTQYGPVNAVEGEMQESSLHVLLLHHIGLNRAYLEYGAHYLDILDYAPTLVRAIDFYETTGMQMENEYVESIESQGMFDLPVFLMTIISKILRQDDIDPAVVKRGFSMEQCVQVIELAQEAVFNDESSKKLINDVFQQKGEAAADSVTLHLVSMSTFCFIWFFLHNQHVNARVYGRKHSVYSLLGDSLNKTFAQLQEGQQNFLKHIVMAVKRSGQIFEINTSNMHGYLFARAFNLVSLTSKVAAIKTMDLHGFCRWAEGAQFAEYLSKPIGDTVMINFSAARISLVHS